MRKWSRASHPVSNYGPWADAERLAAKAATTITVTAVASVAIVVAVVVAGVAQRSVVSHFNCLSLFNFQLFCYCHHGSDAYTRTLTHTHTVRLCTAFIIHAQTHTYTHTYRDSSPSVLMQQHLCRDLCVGFLNLPVCSAAAIKLAPQRQQVAAL